MNIERLQDVIRAIENDDDEHFDMKVWQRGKCGCAVGLYCKANPDSELKLWRGLATVIPEYGRLSDWPAVASFFDLTLDDAQNLFAGYRYPTDVTREMVIARIQFFIASGGEL